MNVSYQKILHRWGVSNTETLNLLREVSSYYEKCIDSLAHDLGKLQELVQTLKTLSIDCGKNVATKPNSNPIKDIVEILLVSTFQMKVTLRHLAG